MGKDMIIRILQGQLEAANATILQQSLTISGLNATVADLKAAVANLESLLAERDGSLAKAQSQMRGMAKIMEKKSERQRPKAEAPGTEEERKAEEDRRAAERKARGNNDAKRDMHFEVETLIHEVYAPGCEGMPSMSVRESVRYRMIPLRFVKDVYRIHTVKVGDRLVSGTAPRTPLQNSRYDGSFVAGIAQLRYMYAMPVERIVSLFRDNGFNLGKQTAHGLLKKTAWMFENLYRAMRGAVKEDGYLCCDETYHKVLVDPASNSGKGSRKGYIWAMVAVHLGLVYFFYEDGSRSERVILDELRGYGGVIQSDGLRAYKSVMERSDGEILRLSCLQHCKRGFVDMKGNPDADEILSLANELYVNEHRHHIGSKGWTVEDNLRWRQEYAPPILERLKHALLRVQAQKDKYPPSSQMEKAANYFLNEWDGIEAIASGGDYSWDTNIIERLNRYISLSRRNSMFFGSHAGAERGAVFYSLACSCRLHKINFFEYISDVLNRMAYMRNGARPEDFRELLPDRWKKIEQG